MHAAPVHLEYVPIEAVGLTMSAKRYMTPNSEGHDAKIFWAHYLSNRMM